MLCLACDCVAVKMWTRVLPFWIDGVSVCQAWSCCFQDGYFLPFLTLEMGRPTSLMSPISLPVSTSSRVMCSWVLALSMRSESLVHQQQHRRCWSLGSRFSKVTVVKDVLTDCRSLPWAQFIEGWWGEGRRVVCVGHLSWWIKLGSGNR